MQMQFNPYDQTLHDQLEHQRVLLDLDSLMSHDTGRRFVKYLMKNFGVGDLPPIGVDADFLRDYMGFLRAGKSIFDIASQANAREAGLILAEIQKEKYDVEKIQNSNG